MSDPIAFGKSRADSSSVQIDFLLALVHETENVPGDIFEIGSWKCGTSICMAASTEREVYAFDMFGGLPYGYGHGFENFVNVDYVEVRRAIAPYKNLHLIRGMHEITVPAQPKKPISLIYLDSDHYSSHRVTLEHFGPLVSSGGLIVFHDWTFPAVQQAIREVIDPAKFVFAADDIQGMRFIRAL